MPGRLRAVRPAPGALRPAAALDTAETPRADLLRFLPPGGEICQKRSGFQQVSTAAPLPLHGGIIYRLNPVILPGGGGWGWGPQSQTRRFRLRTERERFPPVASVSEPTGCHSGAATRLLPNPAVPFSSRGRAGAPTGLLATLCDALTATRDVPGTRVASFGPPSSPPFCKTSHQSALKIGCTKSITMLPTRRSVSTWGGPRKVIPSEGPLEKISICSQDQKQPCPPTPPAGSAHVMVISLTESDHVSLLLLAA